MEIEEPAVFCWDSLTDIKISKTSVLHLSLSTSLYSHQHSASE